MKNKVLQLADPLPGAITGWERAFGRLVRTYARQEG
jgi:hypothetical protein